MRFVDQKCDRMIDPNWSYADILGLEVHVEVTNSTTDPMTFVPAKVRLLADGEARKPHKSDDSALIPAGASKIFKVTFLKRDDTLACNVPMALSVADAATTGSSTLPLRPNHFSSAATISESRTQRRPDTEIVRTVRKVSVPAPPSGVGTSRFRPTPMAG